MGVLPHDCFQQPLAHQTAVRPLPEVEPSAEGAAVAPWSVSAAGFGRFMADVFDVWVRRDIGTVFVQLFDSALAAWCGRGAAVCSLGRTCSGTAVVEHNGDVYACDHFVYDSRRLGNLTRTPLRELVCGEEYLRFALAKTASLAGKCMKCPYLPPCNGECPKHRQS